MLAIASCSRRAASALVTASARGPLSTWIVKIAFPLPAFELPWMGLPPGTWTDDTAMARNLWRSLIEHEGTLDLDDVLRRHLAWLKSDPPDVGNQTRLALAEAAAGTPDPARAVFERRGPEVSAGNGSVMYCAGDVLHGIFNTGVVPMTFYWSKWMAKGA